MAERTAGPSATLRSLEKHFQERAAEPQVPPLRYAPVGMTKGREGASKEVAEREPVSSAWVGPLAHDSCARDDNSVAWESISRWSSCGHNRIVIPTGAQRSGGTCGSFGYLNTLFGR
jgi:hypothetical protein